MRFEDAYEGVHHLGWGKKLASLGARIIGKLLDEIFISAAQHVRRDTGVGKIVGIEVLNQRAHGKQPPRRR
jgi:hypothetical protein